MRELHYTGLFLLHIKSILFVLFVFLLSTFLTWLMKVYAVRKLIFDIPNERSSHTIPTPRGGGIAIVLTFIFSLLWLRLIDVIESSLVWTLVGGGIVIAILGYCDDVYSVKSRLRILIHFIVAMWSLYWLGGLTTLDLGTVKIQLHGIGYLLTIIGFVWCINFYNFMDGIDGLASSEAIFVSLASGITLLFLGKSNLAMIMWLLFASVSGFVLWNWPPAKIFLGDVGSGFLGFVFAALGLYTINKGFLPLSFWMILLAVFLLDATFTLLYRVYHKKAWYSAHREHAYQHLISYGATHRQITVSIILINFCILLPCAGAVFYWPQQSIWFLTSLTIIFWSTWYWIKSI